MGSQTVNTASNGVTKEKEILLSPIFNSAVNAEAKRSRKQYESGTVLDGRLQFITTNTIPSNAARVGCINHDSLEFLGHSVVADSFSIFDTLEINTIAYDSSSRINSIRKRVSHLSQYDDTMCNFTQDMVSDQTPQLVALMTEESEQQIAFGCLGTEIFKQI